MGKSVRFDELVTVFYFKSDKAEKKEDRLADIIRELEELFEQSPMEAGL